MALRAPGRRHANRARPGLADDRQQSLSGSSPPDSDWRDWASLTSGPTGLIAERVLATNNVADCIRFRAVCTAWRACCPDPRSSSVSDRRFHPRQWIMLPSASKHTNRRRCFLNVYTGKRIRVRLPGLPAGYSIIGPILEGLLILQRTHVVQLLNPLTGQLTDLPCVLPSKSKMSGGGIADDSTVAFLCDHRTLAVAKPGDADWTRVTTDDYMLLALPFAGRLYCITVKNILVVQTAANHHKPRLVVAAELKLPGGFSWTNHYLYPVYDDVGDLILVHRHTTDRSRFDDKFAAYRVKLDTGNMEPIHNLGGQALFLCASRSQSVDARISSPIRADTIYVCTNDVAEGEPEVISFDLAGTCIELYKQDVPNYLFNYVCS